jgi:hypothetical protein
VAGTSPDFDSDGFRSAFRDDGGVFDIFAPPDVEERATFYFPNQLVYTVGTDDDDVPFDRSALPINPQPVEPVRVPCAVEYYDAAGNLTDFGVLIPSRAAITLMDVDYHRIDGSQPGTAHFSYVMLRGEKFVYRHTEYPAAIFDVALYTVHVFAEGER